LKLMKKLRKWQVIYLLCSLAYMGWVMHVGTNEFDRVNGQYRRLAAQLDAGRIRTAALEELSSECRRDAKRSSSLQEETCLSWPPRVVEAKAREIEEQRQRARTKGTIKLVLFYGGFAAIFLLGPPLLLYLLLSGIITLYRNIRIVR
jgi:hypothetical protein